MYRAYRFAIGYFALFGLLLMLSGGWLFMSKIGFSVEGTTRYYFGSAATAGKSAYGLLEMAVPHLAAMGLFIMVSAHFMLFAPARAKHRALTLVYALFAAAAADIGAGSAIAAGLKAFAWVKLGAFFALMTLSTWLLLLICRYAFWHSLSPRRHRR
jgi:hypothetical protein